jgi:hypothetical protein
MPINEIIKKFFGGQRVGGGRAAAERPPTGTASNHWISNPWHAVSVVPCRGACIAARESSGVRFLSKEAPVLPLSGCPMSVCTCRYRHHEDRRRELRRAADVLAQNRHWPGRERREARGRRATDHS